MRTYCISQGTLPSGLRRSKWEGKKEGMYVYVQQIHFAVQ